MTDEEEKKLKELRAEHGIIATAPLAGGMFYFRTPTMAEYQRVQDKLAGKGSGVIPLRELVYSCSVGPDHPKDALMQKPAAVQNIGMALLEMAGNEVEVTISKD